MNRLVKDETLKIANRLTGDSEVELEGPSGSYVLEQVGFWEVIPTDIPTASHQSDRT
jgi:hypothetical protein